jgi:hypothetical protein
VGLWFAASEDMASLWRAGFPSGDVEDMFCAEASANTMHPITAVTHGQIIRTCRRWFKNRNVCMAAASLYNQSQLSSPVLKSIGKLQNELADLGWIVAVEKLIVAFKEQRVCEIIYEAGSVSLG